MAKSEDEKEIKKVISKSYFEHEIEKALEKKHNDKIQSIFEGNIAPSGSYY